jgi:hypothetical protein
MSQKEKLLEKVRRAPGNVRWNQVLKLMAAWGFVMKPTEEGAAFLHPTLATEALIVLVPKPHRDKVKQPYVRQCLKAIDLLLEKEEKENEKS